MFSQLTPAYSENPYLPFQIQIDAACVATVLFIKSLHIKIATKNPPRLFFIDSIYATQTAWLADDFSCLYCDLNGTSPWGVTSFYLYVYHLCSSSSKISSWEPVTASNRQYILAIHGCIEMTIKLEFPQMVFISLALSKMTPYYLKKNS